MQYLSILPLLASAVFAAPLQERSAPSVTIANGTVIGSSSGGVDSFKGIPFAQPPVGNLRLRPPQSINKSFGTITATGIPRGCPQMYVSVDNSNLPEAVIGLLADTPLVQTVSDAGEDCLTLNVQRPSTATSSSKLPVVFWIYGGGFEFGSTQLYDGSALIQKSMAMANNVIFVAVNYRVGGFGFLAGNALASEGSTNLGLRDQRLGLQWVAENIAAFGGDPDKVTIWGESAGSISVFDHTIINGGDNTYMGKPLFRAAIMDSGSVVPVDPVTASQANTVFTTVAQYAGCSGNSEATLTCLRNKDYTTLLNAMNSVPGILGPRSLDLSYLPRPDSSDNFFSQSPDVAVTSGKFAKVPIIIGDQEDEGTLFALTLSNLQTNDDVVNYLASYFPGDANAEADVAALMSHYPDEPLLGQPAGSPFRTGIFNNIYPQFKRVAAVLGDITFTLTRRVYLDVVSSQVKAWSYLNTNFYGTPILGTFHATDILTLYFTPALPAAQATMAYYISFITKLDPNTLNPSMTNWPQWDSTGRNIVNFSGLTVTADKDNFREDAYQYLKSKTNVFKV
ncbi:putative secreted lipase [Acrodontium crateriforme]|uniref:Carboxylic ester hydrolase n=1 Tax=Acrodontium crateriforme TaxID=150365 RepID=A0AAQ3M4H0_9PEZI|nr:putative secreted lipase [Acrodontium crateriforme]